MTITALQRKGSNVLVCFDECESVNLDYRTVLDNGLRKNDSIDENKLAILVSESTFLKLKDSAFRLLGRRHHSTSELRLKLHRKKVSKEIVEKVLSDLTEKKLLDDEQFAIAYMEERSLKKKIGINKLRAELFRKGIARDIVDRVILNVNPDLSYSQAFDLADRKIDSLRHQLTDRKKLKLKLFSFLSSRGFESDIIMKVLSGLKFDDDD